MSSVKKNTLPEGWEEKRFEEIIESHIIGLVVAKRMSFISIDFLALLGASKD